MARFMKVLFLLLLTASAQMSAVEAREDDAFRLGVISSKPQKRLRDYAPFAKYVANRLTRDGIENGKVIVAKDLMEMLHLIREKQVDVVFESALSSLEMEEAGMVPSLLAWRKGVREYRTLFVVRKDSAIKTPADLKGKTIALEDPYSTSAFAIPLAELKKIGLRSAPAGDKQRADSQVEYSFAGEALNEAYWVALGRADAAAFSNNDWDELPEKVKAELRIIHETTPILRFVVSIRGDIPALRRQAIEKVLVDMDKNPKGLRVLKEASEIKRIEPLTDRDRQSLEYVRQLKQFLD